MKLRYILYVFLLLLHEVIWTSCSGCLDSFGGDYGTLKVDSASGVVYDQFIALPDRGWDKRDSAVFELPLFERDADLDVTISVRHTNRYPYQNLQLVAFLAELDTSNIINSLPIRKNDGRIDSLIHRQDSLKQEKAQTEQKLAERKAHQDSLGISQNDSLKQNNKVPTEAKDTLKKDTLAHVDQKPASEEEKRTAKDDELKSEKKKLSTDKDSSESDNSAAKREEFQKTKEGKKASKKRSSKPTPNDSLTHVIEFRLFNSEDEKNGSGMMFVETEVSCGTIHLKANTRYKIFITHNMKEERLKGISDIGIELTGCKKQPIDKMSTKWWDKQKHEN